MQNEELMPSEDVKRIAEFWGYLIKCKKEALEIVETWKGLKPPTTPTPNQTNQPQTPNSPKRTEEEKELLRIGREIQKTQAQINTLLSGQSTESLRLKATKQQQLALQRAIAKEEAQEVGSVGRMQAELSRRIVQLNQINITTKKGMDQYQQELNEVIALHTKVSALEQQRGQFGRNVGNYSGFSPIANQVQQVLREVPSSISLDQFFLAISNNLPILADSIELAKKDIAIKKEQGKTYESVGKQVFKSVFSLQTLMIVGITVLSKYGAEIIKWAADLIKGKDAALDVADAVDKVNEKLDFKETGEAATKLEQLRREWIALGGDIKKQEKFIKDSKKDFEDLGTSVTTIKEAENLLITNTPLFIESIRQRAIATATAELAAEKYAEYLKQLDKADQRQRKGPTFWDQFIGGFNRIGRQDTATGTILQWQKRVHAIREDAQPILDDWRTFLNLSESANKEVAALFNKGGFSKPTTGSNGGSSTRNYLNDRLKQFKDEAKAYEKLTAEEFRMRQWTNKQIMDNDAFSIEERQAASNRYYELERQRVSTLTDLQIKNLKAVRVEELTNAKKREVADATKADINKVALTAEQVKEIEVQAEKDTATEVKVVRTKAGNDMRVLIADQYQSRLNIVLNGLRKEIEASEAAESDNLAKLDQNRAKGLISQKEYEDERIKIAENADRDRLQMQLDALNNELRQLPLDDDSRIAVEDAISKKVVEIAKWEADQKNRIAKQSIDYRNSLEQERRQFVTEMAQQAVEFISNLAKGQIDQELADIKREQEAAEEAAEEEKNRIERLADAGVISEEQKNARIALADQQLAEKQKEIEKRKQDAEIRQAIYDKAAAIAQATINTSLAISTTLAQWGPILGAPFIAMAAALGAVQVATIAAQPLPKYATGTDFHPGGLAVVGDGGRPELMLVGGYAYKTPSVPTLVDMPKGAQVMPDYNVAIRDMIMMSTRENGRPVPKEMPRAETFSDRAILAELRQARMQRAQMIRNDERARRQSRFIEFKNRPLR